MKRKANNKTKH